MVGGLQRFYLISSQERLPTAQEAESLLSFTEEEPAIFKDDHVQAGAWSPVQMWKGSPRGNGLDGFTGPSQSLTFVILWSPGLRSISDFCVTGPSLFPSLDLSLLIYTAEAFLCLRLPGFSLEALWRTWVMTRLPTG